MWPAFTKPDLSHIYSVYIYISICIFTYIYSMGLHMFDLKPKTWFVGCQHARENLWVWEYIYIICLYAIMLIWTRNWKMQCAPPTIQPIMAYHHSVRATHTFGKSDCYSNHTNRHMLYKIDSISTLVRRRSL